MTKEQTYFLKILEDHINGRKTEYMDDVDWKTISRYAKEQELQGIVYYQCKQFLRSIPELAIFNNQLNRAYTTTLYMYVAYKHAYQEIRSALQEEGIRCFLIKGLELSSAYPVPALRTMGDLDIVFSTEDREKTIEVMQNLGYSLQKGAYEWHYYKHEINIEAHDRLLYYEYPDFRTPFFKSCWDYCRDDLEKTVLDDSYHLVFLFEHLKRHFNTHGVGFRQFIDIITYTNANHDFDWGWIESSLAKLGILDFAKNVFYMSKQWWGIEPPKMFQDVIHDKCFIDESTNLIFENGVFGYNNEKHWVNALSGSLNSIKAPGIMKPIIRCFKEVCKPYIVMSKYPYCSFLVGRKYLLPLAWMKRFYYLSVKKRNESMLAIKSMKDHAQISKQLDIRKQWGL